MSTTKRDYPGGNAVFGSHLLDPLHPHLSALGNLAGEDRLESSSDQIYYWPNYHVAYHINYQTDDDLLNPIQIKWYLIANVYSEIHSVILITHAPQF